MRVALVTPYSLDVPGGVGTHVLGLTRWLRRRGVDAYVVAPGTKAQQVPAVLVGRSVGLPFNGSTARLALTRAQCRAGVRAVSGADVVHVHEPLTPGLAFAAAGAATNLVVTHHAAYDARWLGPLLRARASALPSRRVTLAVSRAAAETALRATGRSALIVPNAIDWPKPPAPKTTGRPVVAFVGRLDEPRKGYALFQHIADLVPGPAYVAVGPGGRGAPGIRELGEVSDERRDEVLAAAHIVVAPNLYGESFGLVLVEALARGCAVVASDLPAFREVAGGSEHVSLFKTGDAEAGAAALRARLASAADPQGAWAAGRHFGWDEVGLSILDAYARVLGPVPNME